MTPGWDNVARRAVDALVLKNNTPTAFQHWATELFLDGAHRASPFVFINAWNEWGEGAYLEPDARYGKAFLEANHSARQAAVGHLD